VFKLREATMESLLRGLEIAQKAPLSIRKKSA